jgi:hypothetical protein
MKRSLNAPDKQVYTAKKQAVTTKGASAMKHCSSPSYFPNPADGESADASLQPTVGGSIGEGSGVEFCRLA